MPVVKIKDLGSVGIISDTWPPVDIAPNAFSAAQNIRFRDRQVENFGGRAAVTTCPIEPYGLFGIYTESREVFWIEAGLNKVYVYDGVSHTDITRAVGGDYGLNEYTDRWTGGVVHKAGYLCPGFGDFPQTWEVLNILTQLKDTTYDGQTKQTWKGVNYSAYAMRPYSNALLALNVNKNGVLLPSTVMWSQFLTPDQTEPDFVPRTTNSAGEKSLGDTTGNIIDGGSLRDDFIIYKEDSAHRMSFTGDSANPFIFQRLPEYVRIINRNCIGRSKEFHILASRDDITLFDGNNFRSILDSRRRRFYQNRLWPNRLLTTFVATLNAENETWICFASPGETETEAKWPDTAIVWNHNDDTISDTALPGCRDMDEGIIVPQLRDRFNDEEPSDLTFDEDILLFDQSPFQQTREFIIGAHGTTVSTFGAVNMDDGTPRTCLAERTGLVMNDSAHKVYTVRGFRPYIDATAPVQLQIGAQVSADSPVFWEAEQTFDPRTQREIRARATGSHFGIRIRSNADVRWRCTGYELEYQLRRKR